MAIGREKETFNLMIQSIIWGISLVFCSAVVLNKVLQRQFGEFSIYLVEHQNGEETVVDKHPRISLKASTLAIKVLLVPFSLSYALYFITLQIITLQKMEIVFGIIGFAYFYAIYITAKHLFLKGLIKVKAGPMFFIAFFSSAIPLVHLIVPIYLLKKSKGAV